MFTLRPVSLQAQAPMMQAMWWLPSTVWPSSLSPQRGCGSQQVLARTLFRRCCKCEKKSACSREATFRCDVVRNKMFSCTWQSSSLLYQGAKSSVSRPRCRDDAWVAQKGNQEPSSYLHRRMWSSQHLTNTARGHVLLFRNILGFGRATLVRWSAVVHAQDRAMCSSSLQ